MHLPMTLPPLSLGFNREAQRMPSQEEILFLGRVEAGGYWPDPCALVSLEQGLVLALCQWGPSPVWAQIMNGSDRTKAGPAPPKPKAMPLQKGNAGLLSASCRASHPRHSLQLSPNEVAPACSTSLCNRPCVPTVPTRYGMVLGSIIGGVLLLVLLVVVIAYLIRYCWLRRQAALQRRLR